ncbi:allantoate permease [Scheffersomyces xylosifermentans]|uniref:allantoate permease n=1 Tax=Scheffersomyces xylosifermentans TaxID=1304137 RepID=UPI00315DB629
MTSRDVKQLDVQLHEVDRGQVKAYKSKTMIDHATIFLSEHQHLYPPCTPEEERKLIRKIDFTLVPMLFFTATMGAVDKVSLSTAAIYGFKQDNNLVGQQYSWLGSILFIGSLVGMWPMSCLLQKLPLGKVIVTASLLWSAFTLLLCACHNFAGLAALRFLMGFFECIIVPGCTLVCGRFYCKGEISTRLAFVFAFASSVINGFLSWLVGYFNHSSVPPWKFLYILVGSISFLWGCLMWFYLPDSPINARFLSTKEKCYVMDRIIKQSNGGVETNEWNWSQVREAFLDVKSYIIFAFNICINIPNGGLSTYSAIIINNLGFNAMKSSLMGIPTGVIATLATIFFTYLCLKFNNRRCLIAIISLIIPVIGAAILYSVDQTSVGPQLVGLYFLYFYFAPYVVLMSLAQANTAGNTKKTVAYSINYLGYCVGALIGPQTFRAGQAPKYTGGFIALLCSFLLCILFSALYWWVCVWENSKKSNISLDDESSAVKSTDDSDESEEIYDLTDRQRKSFRYTT